MRVNAFLSAAAVGLAQTEFWNTKEPRNFTAEEKRRLVSDSPWAKTVRCSPADNPRRVQNGSPCLLPGSARGVVSANSNSCPDQSSEVADAAHSIAYYGEVVVRWESAEPIVQVTESRLPEGLHGKAVISVSGLPATVINRAAPVAVLTIDRHRRVRSNTTLPLDQRSLLFAFSSAVPSAKRTINFNLLISGTKVTARFNPKEMLYRGRLAL
jgi:hypothetical protein